MMIQRLRHEAAYCQVWQLLLSQFASAKLALMLRGSALVGGASFATQMLLNNGFGGIRPLILGLDPITGNIPSDEPNRCLSQGQWTMSGGYGRT